MGALAIKQPEALSRYMFFVYIITNKVQGTLYVGHTDDLVRRMWEHKNKVRDGFSAKYNLDKLVWFEQFDRCEYALDTERRMKEWKREWKIEKIMALNPDWNDLTESLSIIR